MGEVVRDFMPMRMAKRYVQILKSKNKDAADEWWKSFKWFPTTEEFNTMQKYITQYSND